MLLLDQIQREQAQDSLMRLQEIAVAGGALLSRDGARAFQERQERLMAILEPPNPASKKKRLAEVARRMTGIQNSGVRSQEL